MKGYNLGNYEKKYNLNEFIGQHVGNEKRYEVVEVWRDEKSNIVFKVKCSECAKDHELFGDGVFTSLKSNIDKGIICCGCSRYATWTKEQQIVRLNRLCKEVGYEFLGFVGEYIGSRTKVKLRCSKDGHEWDTTQVTHLFARRSACPKCKHAGIVLRNSVPEDEAIKSFFATGRFIDGTIFKRTNKYKNERYVWEVYCPKCSNDEYVKAGVCSGVFTSDHGNLAKGSLPCRCSNSYRWSAEQIRYRIEKIIDDERLPYTFTSFVGEYSGTNGSLVTLCCAEHGEWDYVVSEFLGRHSKFCPSCNKFGFDPQEPSSLYVIKVNGSNAFTGYGITNSYKDRRKTHKKNLKKEDLYIEDEVVFDFPDGSGVRSLETTITKAFPVVPQNVEGFIKEATHYHLYNDVVNHVQSVVTQH